MVYPARSTTGETDEGLKECHLKQRRPLSRDDSHFPGLSIGVEASEEKDCQITHWQTREINLIRNNLKGAALANVTKRLNAAFQRPRKQKQGKKKSCHRMTQRWPERLRVVGSKKTKQL